jgi:hypothetical protein
MWTERYDFHTNIYEIFKNYTGLFVTVSPYIYYVHIVYHIFMGRPGSLRTNDIYSSTCFDILFAFTSAYNLPLMIKDGIIINHLRIAHYIEIYF